MSEASAFRTVLRGYDPAEVDKSVAQLRQTLEVTRAETGDRTVGVSKLNAAVAQLQQQLTDYRAKIAALETERNDVVAAPTFADLGQRIGSMLSLA